MKVFSAPQRKKIHILLALLFMMAFGYGLNIIETRAVYAELAQQQAELAKTNQFLIDTTKQLSESKVAVLTQEALNQQLLLQLAKSEDVNKALSEKISFYEQVMAPSMKQVGFDLIELDVTKLASDNHYQFNFILIQSGTNKGVIKGDLLLSLMGKKDGKSVPVKMTTTEGSNFDKVFFRFKFFQKVEQVVVLPDDITPDALTFTAQVIRYKTKIADFEQTFPWSEIVTD